LFTEGNAIQFTKLEAKVHERTTELAHRTAQLEQRTHQLEAFSYSVSHDLRAPLRAINGFAKILSSRYRAGLDERGNHFLDNILEASEHMSRLIEDMLSYSRLGRSAVALQSVSLQDVLRIAERDLQTHATTLGVTINIADDLPDVMADRTLLSQIFTNLLDNALTYRRLNVPSIVTVSWVADGEDAVISVGDNGIGIDRRHFDKIFEVFQRLHGQEDYPGTGIGLAVVRKAAEMLGGSVSVRSTTGVGSTFVVRLIRAAGKAAQRETPAGPAESREHERPRESPRSGLAREVDGEHTTGTRQVSDVQ